MIDIKTNKFINFLENRLKNNLPGMESHLKMVPVNNEFNNRRFEPQQNARESAVLVLIKIEPESHHILFTLRSKDLKSHSGQISFPGGRCEPGEDYITTALRESNEEIGLNPVNVEILGMLSSLYVPPSGSIIFPVVAVTGFDLEFKCNNIEVDEAFFVDINQFNQSNLKIEKWKIQGWEMDVPFWDIHSTTPLWGATSMILSELLDLYNEFKYGK